MQLSLVFSDVTKIADSWWKMLMSTKLEGCVTWYIFFLGAGHPLSHFLSQFCPSCSISQEPYIICMVHMCKIIISPSGFFIFSKCWFFGLLEGSGGDGVKYTKWYNMKKDLSVMVHISGTIYHMTVCSYHVTYVFQSESTLCIYLDVKQTKQMQNLNFKWLQQDSNPQPLSS